MRLDTTNVQAGFLAGSAGGSRVAYNFAVEALKANRDAWAAQRDAGVPAEQRVKPLSAIDVQELWHKAKLERFPWHGKYPSKAYLYAIRNAVKAHRSWMAGTSGFPKFKSRRASAAFRVCETLALEPGRLKIPKLGWVRVTNPDARQTRLRRLIRRGRARIVSATLSRDACGTWWASLTVERTGTHPERPTPPASGVAGVDLGAKTRAVVADSDEVLIDAHRGAKATAKHAKRLAKRQRAMARKDRIHGQQTNTGHPVKSPSKRREAARRAAAATHRRVRNTRATTTHQLTAGLIDLGAVVTIEDLNVAGMMAAGGAHKRGLNRVIADAAFAELRRQLTYKLPADWLIIADRWFPSSKRCRNCQSENQTLTLSDRTWICVTCGVSHDRDVNAAANLAAWGEAVIVTETLTYLWWGTWAGDRHGGGPSAGASQHARRGDEPTRHLAGSRTGACSGPNENRAPLEG